LATAESLRHRYAATALAAATELVGVVSEAKPPRLPCTEPPEDRAVLERHWVERAEAERRLLGGGVGSVGTDVLRVPAGTVNDADVAHWIGERRPDVLVLFGASIVKPPLLDTYVGRVVNVHLGLSPYYRGSGTNFWPLADRRPECIGATVHLAVAQVDAGGILGQVRPEPEATDRAHELGTKTIVVAFRALPRLLERYAQGQLEPVPQRLQTGRVFRRDQFNAAAVRRTWRHFATGMMAEYIQALDTRRAAYPIVPLAN